MAVNRLIVDTDGGVDDAQALLLLIAAGRMPHAVTTAYGNVDLDLATRNVLATLAVAGASIPVHAGAAQPLAEARIDARHVHGDDGLGGAPRPARTAEIAGSDAVGFLASTLEEAAATGDRIDLLTIGPLTNLALALQRAPAAVRGIGRLTIMGGTVYGRGNVTPAAEFNVFCDPEAAAVVFGLAVDTKVVPWEACLAHGLSGVEIDRMFAPLGDSEYRTFVHALVQHDRNRHLRNGKGDSFFFIDPLAAAVAAEPAIVTRSLRASVKVALAPGLTRGMTVVDPSGRVGTPMVTLVEQVDLGRLAALYAASVAYVPRQKL
ncbi:nucleoside hydrolase [Reyranella sp.]|jgi:purine nucleosidase/non-specific riboncleoside hydrolase|uniref:nucleoside hydrolase n=1 Tax=Reyranella sp. TaxID=1929291 RepID=UPI002F953D3B